MFIIVLFNSCFLKYFSNTLSLQNFTLKVDINHCNDCVEKAINKLKKMDGSFTILKHCNNITYSLGKYNIFF